MTKFENIKKGYNTEKTNGRDNVILGNIILHLGKYNIVKIDLNDLGNDETKTPSDVIYIYDNLDVNAEIVDADNIDEFADYLKKIKPHRINYYTKEIKENNKILLLSYYTKDNYYKCFMKFDNSDYYNISK